MSETEKPENGPTRAEVFRLGASGLGLLLAAGGGYAIGGPQGAASVSLATLTGVAFLNLMKDAVSRSTSSSASGLAALLTLFAGGGFSMALIPPGEERLNQIALTSAENAAVMRVLNGEAAASEQAQLKKWHLGYEFSDAGVLTVTATKLSDDGSCTNARVSIEDQQDRVIAARPTADGFSYISCQDLPKPEDP